MLTVIMLVVLRLSLGCHFLYEGVWKITHADEFSAEPFLTQAKGPAAPLFYSMVPDLDGRQRLGPSSDDTGNPILDKDDNPVIGGEVYLAAWKTHTDDTVGKYGLSV